MDLAKLPNRFRKMLRSLVRRGSASAPAGSLPANEKRPQKFSSKGDVSEFDTSAYVLIQVSKILGCIDLEENDFDQLENDMSGHDSHFNALLTMISDGQSIPSAHWYIILLQLVHGWDKLSATQIDNNLVIFECDRSFPAGKDRDTIVALFGILNLLKEMEETNVTSGVKYLQFAHIANKLAPYFEAEAHDLYSLGFNFVSPLSILYDKTDIDAVQILNTAKNFYEIAWKGQKQIQIAVASVVLAEAYVLCAKHQKGLRVDAIRAVERACERLDWAPPLILPELSRQLVATLQRHEYLKPASRKLLDHFAPEYFNELKRVANFNRLVPVIDEGPTSEADLARWIEDVKKFSGLDARLDDTLLEQVHNTSEYHYSFNIATNWQINHGSYLNAVPQSKSFFREKHVDSNLTALIHEVTHLLSLRGGVGFAVLTLRGAMVAIELRLLARQIINKEGNSPDVSKFVLNPAGLEKGAVGLIPDVLTQLTLANKIQLIYRCWMPILEGVAMFAELDADPIQDAEESASIHQMLFGLVDSFKSDRGSMTIEESYSHFLSEYERRASDAIRNCRSEGMRVALEHANESYWSGYLTVRSIVRQWRDTLGSDTDLSCAEALKLLMLALTQGTQGFLAPLDSAIEDFEVENERLMHAWCNSLAKLDKDSIRSGTKYLGPGFDRKWTTDASFRSKVTAYSLDEGETLFQELVAYRDSLVTQVLKPVNFEQNSAHEADRANGKLLSVFNDVVKSGTKKNTEHNRNTINLSIDHLAEHLMQLDFGATESRFYLKSFDSNKVGGFLFVNFRTTECHVESGESSYNALAMSLTEDEYKSMSALYQKYREPRLRIRRTIDLLETSVPRGSYPHFLVFSYGSGNEMTHIVRGASDFGSALLERSEECRDELTRKFGGRSNPGEISALDLCLADGSLISLRAQKWLKQSAQWSLDAYDVGDVLQPVLSQIKSNAKMLRNRREQVSKGNAVARRLAALAIGMPDQGPTDSLNSFRTAMGTTSTYKTMRTIIDTGKVPETDQKMERLRERLNSLGATVISKTDSGYDVVPFAGNVEEP